MEVQFNNAVISGGHPETCKVAMEILRDGGNVVDAAIAAHVAMFVTEPAMASPGGGGFATVSETGTPPAFIDFFCQTPRNKPEVSQLEIIPITVDFGDDQEVFYSGNGSAACPGTIAGLYKMHEKWGSLPMKILFEPGIELMKSGVPLTPFQAYDLHLLREIFLRQEMGRDVFGQDGRIKREGDTIRMEALADFVEVLGIEGPNLFYQGEIARDTAQEHKNRGGCLCREDFSGYESRLRVPLSFHYGPWKYWTTPSPFLGGQIMAGIFKELEERFENRRALMKGLLQSFEKIVPIQKDVNAMDRLIKGGVFLPNKRGATSHFSILDNKGNAVSLTTSIGEGCGYFHPGSGIHMNNMLGELALLPGALHSWSKNQRLNSMMCPTIGLKEGGDVIALGSGGAGRIPYVLSQVIAFHEYAQKVDWEELIEWPRIFLSEECLHFEEPIEEKVWKHWDIPKRKWKAGSLFFGGVNAVAKKEGHLLAAADQRRTGSIAQLKTQ